MKNPEPVKAVVIDPLEEKNLKRVRVSNKKQDF
jgi:hypothetical protein